MGGRIPQNFIDDLLSRVDIVDVIDSRVPLKKKGKDYMACCPFHNEKTPSFSVSQDKQFYYCFGCGASGSALGFLMDYEHMDFVEAIHALARQVGVEVPSEDGPDTPRGPDPNPLYAMLEQAARFYRNQLREHPHASRAIDYLKGRGLTGDIAKDFGIGYAPSGWDNLLRTYGDSDEHKQVLITTGMVIDKGDRCYDRFRDRIMFPIRDRRGRVIAFGGRVLSKDDEPKYLNSPETPVFHKGQELYGLFEARKALRDIPRLLVVEGYMDVVALAQFGIRYAVATLGTATTSEHLNRLFRITEEVVFCFDGDRAGRAAAKRALENALSLMKGGRQARFLFLPEGEDPDSLVRAEGAEAFTRRVQQATPLSDFLLESLHGEADTSSTDGKARLAELAKPMLSRIPQGIYRDLLTERVAEEAGTSSDNIAKHLDEAPPPPAPEARQKAAPASKEKSSLLRNALRCLLQQPALASEAGDIQRFAKLPEKGAEILVKMLDLALHNPQISTGALIEHWHGTPVAAHLRRLAGEALLSEAEAIRTEFVHSLQGLDRQLSAGRTQQRLAELQAKGLANLSEAEKTEFNQLLVSQHNSPAG
ncbi:MAG: DNA primase [Granulosicoccaceae bacterium]|jgi:DNA primase